ncbi:MAG: C40 family peptidase [Rhodobacteraceae bacterium]|nr:C40 family peptidase [Paracoccaceae bacterium]
MNYDVSKGNGGRQRDAQQCARARANTAPARIVKATRRWIGTPYHDQASVRGVGCDCLGLIRGVWREVVGDEPLDDTGPVPPYSRDWGETGPVEVLAEAARAAMEELNISDARTGDVILFRMRAGAIAKHCGILSGRDRGGHPRFIHAYERSGVIEEHLTPAWQRRIAYAFRFPDPAKRKT